MSAITFNHAKDAELAWVDGQIHFSAPSGGPKTEDLGLVPILDAVTSVEVCVCREESNTSPRPGYLEK